MALGLRLLILIPPVIDWDESWVGVGALNVLKGVFPPFFYGQPFMGSLEDYLHALVLAVTGPARWSLKVVPVVVGVAFVYLTFRLARRILGVEAAYAAALVAALPPPEIAAWTVNARLHYSLTPVLGALFLLLTVIVMTRPESRRPARWFILGLLSGLIWWNNYIGVIYLLAGWVLLLSTTPRAFRMSFVPHAIPGFFVGSLPVWLYNVPLRTLFFSPRGTWADWDGLSERVLGFFTGTLPLLMGVASPPRPTLVWALRTILIAGTLALGFAVSVWQAVRGNHRAMLAPLVAVNMVGLAAISVYGSDMPPRYSFPLFTVLPLLTGAAFGAMARRSRAVAWGILALLVAVNGWASIVSWSGLAKPDRVRAFQAEEADEAKLFDRLRELGLAHAYTFGEELNFPAGGSLAFSPSFLDPYPPFARAVDGALQVAFVSRDRDRSQMFETGLAALGADYRVERAGQWFLYHGFSLPHFRYEEIPRDRWTATANQRPELASHAFDRNIETEWLPRRQLGVAFVLDLGQFETLGMLSWLPGLNREVPRRFRVDVSLDGTTWHPVFTTGMTEAPYDIPVYWSGTHPFLRRRRARVEVRFAATPARLVRITETSLTPERHWSIRELFAYRPLADGPAPRFEAIDAVAARLAHAGVSRVFGDHWVVSRLHAASGGTIRVLSPNVYIDNHGRSDLYRGWVHPPDYRRVDRFRFSRTAVVLEQWTGAAPAFEDAILQTGYSYRREVHGEYVLYSRFTAPKRLEAPLPRTGWRASASLGSEAAGLALDGDAVSRWTTGPRTPQAADLWFAVDMGTPALVGAIELASGSRLHDYPRDLTVSYSTDGDRWEALPVKLERWGPLAWDGTHVLSRGVERTIARFTPRTLRAIRVTQTGADGVNSWSIDEFNAYGAAAGLPG